jgi:hypothetical protein
LQRERKRREEKWVGVPGVCSSPKKTLDDFLTPGGGGSWPGGSGWHERDREGGRWRKGKPEGGGEKEKEAQAEQGSSDAVWIPNKIPWEFTWVLITTAHLLIQVRFYRPDHYSIF